jgi:hypothetical protein
MVGLGEVRSYILPDSDFGLSDNHRISHEIMPEVIPVSVSDRSCIDLTTGICHNINS